MIVNRLRILIAERNATAHQVYLDTGIAKSTLSALVNNSSRRIDFETIDKLCTYLGIEPGDFFEYVPVDFEPTIETTNFKVDIDFYDDMVTDITFEFDMFVSYIPRLKKDTRIFPLEGSSKLKEGQLYITVEFEKKQDELDLIQILEQFPAGIRMQFTNMLKRTILREFSDEFKESKFADSDGSFHTDIEFLSSANLFPY